jgi:anti-sigma-K factor RskA
VSGARDHRRWRADLAAYLLGALEPEEEAAVEGHLRECPRCRDELRWLQPAVDVLPESVPPLEPPPALRERLLAEVRADAAAAEGAPAAERRAAAREPLAARMQRFFLRPAAALAAIALIGAVIAGYSLRGGGEGTSTFRSPAAGTVQATVVRKGDGGTMQLTGLHSLSSRHVYEVWVQRGRRLLPSSLFDAQRNGTASTAIPRQLGHADAVLVTVEPHGGSRRPTSNPIVSVPLRS